MALLYRMLFFFSVTMSTKSGRLRFQSRGDRADAIPHASAAAKSGMGGPKGPSPYIEFIEDTYPKQQSQFLM